MEKGREPNLEFALEYLRALERGAVGEELARFFTSDVVQKEYPNRLVPGGATRDLAALQAGAVRGQKVVSNQRYEVRSMLASDDRVALEVDWSATTSIKLGETPAGGVLRAAFAVFLEFRDGRICTQHNYDCFEPF